MKGAGKGTETAILVVLQPRDLFSFFLLSAHRSIMQHTFLQRPLLCLHLHNTTTTCTVLAVSRDTQNSVKDTSHPGHSMFELLGQSNQEQTDLRTVSIQQQSTLNVIKNNP